MSPTISAAAFDMDGLMFNTEDVYWKAASTFLRRRGLEYTRELSADIMGRPPRYCFNRMIEYYGLKNVAWEELHRESEETFIEILDEGFSRMPGLDMLLDTLQRCGIPKGVCTSSTRRAAREVLGRSGVISQFRFVLAYEDVLQGKPDPEIYLTASKTFGIASSEMIVFEDSVSGCTAAKHAGAFTVVVLAEHNRTFDFSQADLIAERLDDPKIMRLFQKP